MKKRAILGAICRLIFPCHTVKKKLIWGFGWAFFTLFFVFIALPACKLEMAWYNQLRRPRGGLFVLPL